MTLPKELARMTTTLNRPLTRPETSEEVGQMYDQKTQAQLERHVAFLICPTRALEPVRHKELRLALLVFVKPHDLKALYDTYHQTGQGLAELKRVEHDWLVRFDELLDRLVERRCLAAVTFAHHDAFVPGPDYVQWNYHRDEDEARLAELLDFEADEPGDEAVA